MTTKFRMALLLFIGAVAFISVTQGFLNALRFSQDFQWSPALLFSQGDNPYQIWLDGNQEGEIIKSQVPNYLHQLYLFFSPFSLLSFEYAKPVWAALNVVIAFGVCFSLAAHFHLSRPKAYLLLFIFLCSTPFRNGLGNGQHALFVLAFLMLPFFQMRGSFVLQGIGFSKYSFAPPFFIYNVFHAGPVKAALGMIIPISGWLAFSVWTATSPFTALTQPLQVASGAVGGGTGDLMTLMESFIDSSTVLSGLAALSLAVALSFFASRHSNSNIHLPLICLISLCTFKHLGYDFVFLLPVLAYSMTLTDWKAYVPIWIVVLWFWFGLKTLHVAASVLNLDMMSFSNILLVVNFLLLVSIIFSLLKERNSSNIPQKSVHGTSL